MFILKRQNIPEDTFVEFIYEMCIPAFLSDPFIYFFS